MPPARYHAPAFALGIALIDHLSACDGPQSLADIARALKTNKNMATRLLATLQEAGWVIADADGPRYRLTLAPFAVTSRVAARAGILDIARPILREAWETTGESTCFAVLHDGQALYLEHFDATGPVRIAGSIGASYPLHCTAPGKILLAHQPTVRQRALILKRPRAYTDATLTSADALARELARVRSQGYALDREEYLRGVFCIAVPVREPARGETAAIGFSVTTLAYREADVKKRLLSVLLSAAERINAHTGAQPARGGGAPRIDAVRS